MNISTLNGGADAAASSPSSTPLSSRSASSTSVSNPSLSNTSPGFISPTEDWPADPLTGFSEKANVLIVDDRPDKLLVFKTILEDLGENVITLQSGEAALRWLLDNECAVMLLDVNMPGMDGFETAQMIRGRRRSAHTPIIFITAHADEMHTAKGYSLGAVDYMLSPAVPSVLRSKVAVFVQLFKLTMQIRKQAEQRISLAQEQAARAAAEELTRRASFLADASKILISSLDINSLMVGATRLVVPMLADFSALALIDGDGLLVRTASVHGMQLDDMRDLIILDPVWEECTQQVLASGLPAFIENLSAEERPALPAGWAEKLAARGNMHGDPAGAVQWPVEHVAMLPLVARGKTYGVLAFAFGPSGRHFTIPDIELATDIASRAAIALDNCLLFKEIQEGDQRKNEFLATLSHELRNPLAPMRTAIHALHLSGRWPADAHDMREMLERQLAHLTHLVNDLLDLARIRQGKIQLRREATDVVAEVNDALETCRTALHEAGHELTVSLPAEPVMVDGDHVRLQQIFENLIFNAGKYTDPHGRIAVSLAREGGDAVFRVKDSGVGIAPHMISQIWEMFAQVDASSDRTRHGLGIGLSLAKKLVHLHGGEIGAHSEGLGKGSEFMVRIPLNAATALPAGNQAGTGEAEDVAPRRILVVDDNVDAAQSLQMLLGVFGHDVDVVFDGVAALARAPVFKPDLVFLDIGLPGMTGYEVATRLRQIKSLAHIKIIALSGYGTESDQQRSKEAGFDRHLVKPIDPNVSPSVIATALPGGQCREVN